MVVAVMVMVQSVLLAVVAVVKVRFGLVSRGGKSNNFPPFSSLFSFLEVCFSTSAFQLPPSLIICLLPSVTCILSAFFFIYFTYSLHFSFFRLLFSSLPFPSLSLSYLPLFFFLTSPSFFPQSLRHLFHSILSSLVYFFFLSLSPPFFPSSSLNFLS